MAERTYPVPRRLQGSVLGEQITVSRADQIIQAGLGGRAQRDWLIGLRKRFVDDQLSKLGVTAALPAGIVVEAGDVDVVVALVSDGRVWVGEWHDDNIPEFDDIIELDEYEVAFAADAIRSGSGLALKAAAPIALLDGMTASAPVDMPTGARALAVVDEADRGAVLELIAVAPGPSVFRRHDGKWMRDDQWLRALRSVKPPPVEPLDDAMLGAVVQQIDEATAGQEWDGPTMADGSPYDDRLVERTLEWSIAAAGRAKSKAYDVTGQMPAQLQKYWLFGKGAAKVRWGTPGAMTRCARQLAKYVGAHRAHATCNNLGAKLGGRGVAWGVTSSGLEDA